jgi:hypothetical protein
MILDDALSDLNTIKRLAAGLSRKRDDIYLLLAEIYRVGRNWRQRGPRALKGHLLGRLDRTIDRRTSKNVFRFVLEVTLEKADAKAKSRYANALRYAGTEGCSPQKLIDFIKRNGGIESCAKRFLVESKAKRSSVEKRNGGPSKAQAHVHRSKRTTRC